MKRCKKDYIKDSRRIQEFSRGGNGSCQPCPSCLPQIWPGQGTVSKAFGTCRASQPNPHSGSPLARSNSGSGRGKA
ncbi:hypothetical protein KSS87_011149 [Heliosperma pusillum]|nr:hypothetical protein KSS87_011149 [Heliosperma pusillum]